MATCMSAVVLDASAKRIQAIRQNGETIEITGDGLQAGSVRLVRQGGRQHQDSPWRGDSGRARRQKRPGKSPSCRRSKAPLWRLTRATAAIKALVGGFDFEKNKFNHVTQAWRQPGSSFKPFIYSAALEEGVTPATVINDAPLFFDAGVTGGQPWEPKNYDGKFEGPMTMRRALAKSKNMVSIRILQTVGAQNAQDWVTRFGFDADKHPAYLTMALGAGSVTPDADGQRLLGVCQWRLPRQPLADQPRSPIKRARC